MEYLYISVLLLPMYSATAMASNCSAYNDQNHCNSTSLAALNTTFCYIYVSGNGNNNFFASVQCKVDSKNYTFNCSTTGSNKTWSPPPRCPTADPSETPATTSPPSQSSSTTLNATTVTSGEIATSDTSEMSTTPTTAQTGSSAGTTETSSSTRTQTTVKTSTPDNTTLSTRESPATSGSTETASPTRTQTTEKTSSQDNTTLSTRKSPATSDDSGTVVVATVSVFVVVVIALAAVVVFLLWRQRRLKQQSVMGGNSGTSLSNRTYEDDHGLERHISLLDMRPDDSVDSGYAEISPGNLNVEESPGNVYQTIDNVPEEKAESGNDYGHLKMQTTTFIDDRYSHVTVKPNGKPSSDATYAHTGNPTNVQEIRDDRENDTTYNHLENTARETQGNQLPSKKEKREIFYDVEAEYSHARAGQQTLEPDNKGDTYSHLNQTWQRPQANQQTGSTFLTQGSKPQMDRSKPKQFDSDKDVGRNTFPEYAKCAKKLKQKPTPKPVGRDGYETPTGTANIYLTLEPDSTPADADVSFQVAKGTFEESESPYHQYFILEKNDTDT